MQIADTACEPIGGVLAKNSVDGLMAYIMYCPLRA